MTIASDFLKYCLRRTGSWRRKLAERYPDQRNLRAAEALDRLARTPERDIDPELLALAKPYLIAGTPQVREAIAATARRVEFSMFPADLDEFIETLLEALWQQTGSPPVVATQSAEVAQ